MLQKLLTLLFIFTLFIFNSSYAEDIDVDYEKNISSGTEFVLDLSDLEDSLEDEYNANVFFEWDIRGASTQNGSTFIRTFQSAGEKEINLTIYRNIAGQKNLIASENIELFVYESALPFLYDSDTPSDQIENFNEIARKSGIYLYNLGVYNKENIDGTKIVNTLEDYKALAGQKSNYIGVWGGKEFILNAAGQMNKRSVSEQYNQKLNFVIFSSFNTDVLENFVSNFLSDKSNINKIIISDEGARFQAIEKSLDIDMLITHLKENDHPYKEVKTTSRIKSLLFISKFVNNLSSAGFKADSIYLIIVIPILLLGLSIMKHIVGFSPLGIMIPVGITLALFEIGVIPTMAVLLSMLFINLLLGKIMGRYTLLYTPKVSLLLGINIVFIIAILNVLFQYDMIAINIENIIFILLFILICEKLITLIVGKEFREYKYSLVYTFAFSLISFVVFSWDYIQIFILAYPEIILLLIPINFWIGQFTGLRITEYFRFKEIIHNIDEEE